MTNVRLHCPILRYIFECRRVWGRAAGEDPLQQEGFSTDSDGRAAPSPSRYVTDLITIHVRLTPTFFGLFV